MRKIVDHVSDIGNARLTLADHFITVAGGLVGAAVGSFLSYGSPLVTAFGGATGVGLTRSGLEHLAGARTNMDDPLPFSIFTAPYFMQWASFSKLKKWNDIAAVTLGTLTGIFYGAAMGYQAAGNRVSGAVLAGIFGTVGAAGGTVAGHIAKWSTIAPFSLIEGVHEAIARHSRYNLPAAPI